MIRKLFDYWIHRLVHKGELRLGMSILAKNEADIIEDNIRYHSSVGVDCFVVMDNGSTDGTRDILQKLSHELDLHIIDQPDTRFQQSQWVTEMAIYCKRKLKADLVINNDADEFWEPDNGMSLKSYLSAKDSVVTVRRYNTLLPKEAKHENFDYRNSNIIICNGINSEPKSKKTIESMLLNSPSPKTIINPYGLKKVKTGNHRASHVCRIFNGRTEDKIKIVHLPIRSYKQFKKRFENRSHISQLNFYGLSDETNYLNKEITEEHIKKIYERFILSDNIMEFLNKAEIITIHKNNINKKISVYKNKK
ncbi:glycosyltransferase family 2 protein (plasmid) [Amphritea atlantica]|uniref:Glycosyltransferase family 2 protein n=1 Tax=Amphritea atlantica TaxID=355243 RepID=A0ABY5H0W6_9GAMM|nr:glycosyltransferase family 2 protein [Amphritea atlantica]